MKRIKKSNVPIPKDAKAKKSKSLLIGIIFVLVICFTVLIIFIENNGGKLTISNKTDLKLEYVKMNYVYQEGPLSDPLLFENINPNTNTFSTLEEIDFNNLKANLEVRFKFENYDEMFVDAGYFNTLFDGNVKIVFAEAEGDNLVIKVKASNGILPSPTIDCNEEFIIYLSEGYVE